MSLWILALSYWIHLLSTVVWFGGLAVMGLAGLPAFRQGVLEANQWLALQKRFVLWVNGSLVLLLITGFVQMTNDANYNGFLAIDSIWAWAMLLKHVAYGLLVLITAYLQFGLYPAMARTAVLAQKRPRLAAAEQGKLSNTEARLLKINLVCA
ncbi:MAG: hypothetical protein KC421_08690, partial [Anaerolineales bacterium]|nr:hypothetical protein [Anaerolineales bacterium]